jgi:hypothetical protein
MIDNCPKGLKKKRDRFKAVSIAAFLFLSLMVIGPCSAQGLIGAPDPEEARRVMAEEYRREMSKVHESDRLNYLSTLVTVLLFLKLGIPLFKHRSWWKKNWPALSFSVPFLAGVTVDIFYKTFWMGGLMYEDLLEGLTTGMLFGTPCLVTAAIFHASQPMAPETFRANAVKTTGKI